MGRQVNFLMTDKDEEAFVDFVRGTGDVLFLPSYPRSADPELMPLPPEPGSVEHWESVSIVNRSVPWRMSIRPVKLGGSFPPGYYVVSPFKSNVIAWSRDFSRAPPSPPEIYDVSKLRDTVRCGRVWVDGPIFHSQPEFGRWYGQIARWLKKNYVKIDQVVRAGPSALALWKESSRERSEIYKGQVERLCLGFLQGGPGLTEEWLKGNLRSSEFPEVVERVLRERAAEFRELNPARHLQLMRAWNDVRSEAE